MMVTVSLGYSHSFDREIDVIGLKGSRLLEVTPL